MGKDMGIWLRHHDVIGHVRKLKKSYHFTNLLNIRLQKELGRYLFPVFLEKRKSKRHSKKYPPKEAQTQLYLVYLYTTPYKSDLE